MYEFLVTFPKKDGEKLFYLTVRAANIWEVERTYPNANIICTEKNADENDLCWTNYIGLEINKF